MNRDLIKKGLRPSNPAGVGYPNGRLNRDLIKKGLRLHLAS
ncbi:protein of unknown function [Methylocaldum szegediense]|uniref:Uncharacterized protein n=1 Tax=Methylocaldum szegediense TaxID=73780 RepID=A0ABM9HYJ1_9GAMM|nr:protein of unknown function [Methylocaldum szegediense]